MGHLHLEDVVPSLRADLKISAPPTGAGAEVIRVGPRDADENLRMRGFEFSIARMLDGRRTAREVMQNCASVGLPLDLEGLEGFVHQLEANGLLADDWHPGLERAQHPTRSRTPWSPEVRELYRNALRRTREGKPLTARATVDRLLKLAPATPEAVELRDWLEEQNQAANRGLPFQTVFHAAEELWHSELVAPPVSVGTLRPLTAPLLLVAAAALLAGLAVLLPLPRLALASAHFAPVAEVPVLADRGAVVASVAVEEGQTVAEGDELFVWDDVDTQIRLAEAREELEEARRPLRDFTGQTTSGKAQLRELNEAENDVARAQAALLADQKANAGALFDGPSLRSEERFAEAMARRDRARAALDARLPGDAPEAAHLQALTAEIQQLEGQLAHRRALAPHAGQVVNLAVAAGQRVEPRAQLVQIDDHRQLEVVATVTPRVAKLAQVGAPLTVRLDGVKLPTTIDAVNEFEIRARVNNPEGTLKTGTYSVNLEFAARPLWAPW